MHPLLVQGSVEASRLFDSIVDLELDWTKLRVSLLPKHFSNPEFLRVLRNGTRAVSVQDFKYSFSKAVVQLRSVLNSGRWFAVLVSREGDFSRSLYFFLLALNLCPDIGENLQGLLHLPKRFELSNYFTDFTYVCFDDVVVSGIDIESSFKHVSNMPRIVVAPFVSELSLGYLGNLGIKVVHTEVVRQFVKFDPSRSNTVDSKYEAHPLFLSHRSLEGATGFPEIYKGLCGERKLPPWVRVEYSRYEYLLQDIVKEFVSTPK